MTKLVLDIVRIAALLGMACAAGCSPRKEAAFTSATVSRYDPVTDRTARTIRTSDAATIARLTSFFPGVREGRLSSRDGGGWIATVTIAFARADGSSATVYADAADGVWSIKGKSGESPSKPGMNAYVGHLFESAERAAEDGTEPVGH